MLRTSRYTGFLLLLIVAGLLLPYGCNRNPDTPDNAPEERQKPETQIRYALHTRLTGTARKELGDEKAWEQLSETMQSMAQATTGQVLIEAQEVRFAVQKIRDSLKNSILQRTDVKAYLNILWNNALRLEDMKDIPAVTGEEVKEQAQKILMLYEALVEKINSVSHIRRWEAEMQSNPDFEKVLNDSLSPRDTGQPGHLPAKPAQRKKFPLKKSKMPFNNPNIP